MYKLYIVTTVLHEQNHVCSYGVSTSTSVSMTTDTLSFDSKDDADLAQVKLTEKHRAHILMNMNVQQAITKLYD